MLPGGYRKLTRPDGAEMADDLDFVPPDDLFASLASAAPLGPSAHFGSQFAVEGLELDDATLLSGADLGPGGYVPEAMHHMYPDELEDALGAPGRGGASSSMSGASGGMGDLGSFGGEFADGGLMAHGFSALSDTRSFFDPAHQPSVPLDPDAQAAATPAPPPGSAPAARVPEVASAAPKGVEGPAREKKRPMRIDVDQQIPGAGAA